MYTIEKDFTICCSHRLYDDKLSKIKNQQLYGKCNNMHGHNYDIKLVLEKENLQNGMIINFNEIKEVFKIVIDDKFDHKCLNDCKEFNGYVPTAENMCKIFFYLLTPKLHDLSAIQIHETNGACATYRETE